MMRMREDLIDQHVAYFLRKNPEAKMHKLACSGMIGMIWNALNKQACQIFGAPVTFLVCV